MRLGGILWLVAALTAGFIAFFLVDPIDLVAFVGGALLGGLLGLAILVRPDPRWTTWSNVLGVVWFLVFGAFAILNLSLPIEQLLSVVWVWAWGVAGAEVVYRRRMVSARA
jgi:hypothetical protein